MCFVVTQTVALAGPHEEGVVAGQAAIPIVRDKINQSSTSAIVPGYTTTPPESAYYGQPNLAGQANARLINCAALPDDAVCQAQRGAVNSASTSRESVGAYDPAVAGANQVASNPSTGLGDLSSYYAGCTASTCPTNVFCLGSSCFNINYANDADFARSTSMMEAAREAGVYLDTDKLQVFN